MDNNNFDQPRLRIVRTNEWFKSFIYFKISQGYIPIYYIYNDGKSAQIIPYSAN